MQSESNWNMSTSNIPNIWYQSNETEYQCWIEIKSGSLKWSLGWVTSSGTRSNQSLGGRQARVKAASTDPNLDSNWKIQMLSDL